MSRYSWCVFSCIVPLMEVKHWQCSVLKMICRRKVLVVLLLTFCVGAKGCYVYPEGKTDPCQNKTCHFYGRCIPSDNGKSWQCICPQYCYDYGDNVDNKPVCGSNNVEYPNLCSFQKAACENQRNMTYTYGKCGKV